MDAAVGLDDADGGLAGQGGEAGLGLAQRFFSKAVSGDVFDGEQDQTRGSMGGDAAQMWNSLQRLARLPEETRVYPGHNYGDTETSTIAHELRENRFLRCASLDEFRVLRERKRA